jgi:hypothetical protein
MAGFASLFWCLCKMAEKWRMGRTGAEKRGRYEISKDENYFE